MPLPRRHSEPGPILAYLDHLARNPDEKIGKIAEEYRLAVRDMLVTPQGRMFLELLETSTVMRILPASADERALAVRNAQGLIASDLRRIASNETELLREAA